MSSQPASRNADTARVTAPPPLIFLAAIAAGEGLRHIFPLPLPAAAGIAGQLAVALGFVLILWSVLAFRRRGTPPNPYRPTTALVVTGPFRVSRNPIYLGFALVHLGIGLCLASGWIVMMLLPALIVMRIAVIAREELYLAARFGEDYRRYCRQVRRWI